MKRRNQRANFSTTIAEQEELLEQDASLDDLDDMEYENELFRMVSENIDAAEESAIVDEDTAQALRSDLLQEHQQRLAELMELDAEGYDKDEEYGEDDEDAEYSAATPLATFRSATTFGSSLLDIAAQAGYESVEDFGLDLADALGIDDESAAGLLTGELIPDEEVFDALADVLDLDEALYEQLADVAEAERQAIYEEMGETEDEEELEEAAYSYHDARIEELEGQIAEFQAQQVVSDRLAQVQRQIEIGISGGWMPPSAGKLLIGDFDRDSDRVAAFSRVCSAQKVSPEAELYAIEKTIEAFRQCFEGAPIAQFGAFAEAPLEDREIDRQEEIWEQAKRNRSQYRR